MRALSLVAAIAVYSLGMLPGFSCAQSKDQGLQLFREAEALHRNAGSLPDLQKAAVQYERAVKILEAVGDLGDVARARINLGSIAYGVADYPKAEQCYRQALEAATKTGDAGAHADSLTGLGTVNLASARYREASEHYEKSLEIARRSGDAERQLRNLAHLGAVYRYLGKIDKAEQSYKESLELANNSDDRSAEGLALNNLGNIAADRGQYEQAVEYCEKGLATAKKAGDLQAAVHTLMNLGKIHAHWGLDRKSEDYFAAALETTEKAGDISSQSDALQARGDLSTDRGGYRRAVEHYEKALKITRNVGHTRNEAVIRGKLGNACAKWGRYGNALSHYERALEIARKTGDPGLEASSLNNLGMMYTALARYPQALKCYRESAEIATKNGLAKLAAGSVFGIATVSETAGRHEEAVSNYEKAQAGFVEAGVPAVVPRRRIAALYLSQGDVQKAEMCAKEADDPGLHGVIALAKGDYGAAKSYYTALRKKAEKRPHSDNFWIALVGLGTSHELLGEYSDALQWFLRAADLTEEIRLSLSPIERTEFSHVRVGGFLRTAAYEGLARVSIRTNKPLAAFVQSEYTKVRAFAEILSRKGELAGMAVRQDLLETDWELNAQCAALSRALQKAKEKNHSESITVLEPKFKEAGEKLATHVAMLRKGHPTFAAAKYPEPVSLGKSALTEKEWVLAYDVTDYGVLIYLTRGRELVKAAFKEVPRREVDAAARGLRQSLTPRENEPIVRTLERFDLTAAGRLSQILLAPVLTEIPEGASLIILPDESLGALPFEVLPLDGRARVNSSSRLPTIAGARFFGDRNPISYTQSVTSLSLHRTVRSNAKPGSKILVIMADPVIDRFGRGMMGSTEEKTDQIESHSADELPLSGKSGKDSAFSRSKHAADLGSRLKKNDPVRTDLWDGADACKARLLAADLTLYRAVVFGTGGYMGMDFPGILEPVLAPSVLEPPQSRDGVVRLTEVMGLKLNAEIAALTATTTGVHSNLSGRGTMAMGRAFQYAGARSVLMSLWCADDNASEGVVERFFTHLGSGENKLEALRRARREIRDQGFDHPFFWARLILIGEAD
ncbi:MAG: tetratricopeptide repeat protein [Thermodesulfobacteriota bacterium]